MATERQRDSHGESEPSPAVDSSASDGDGDESRVVGQTAPATHVRGSTLLLAGRVLALLLSGIAQVLIVRSLSKSDYGAFAYALSIATFLEMVLTIAHRQSLSRFLSIYEERNEHDKLFGTMIMVFGTIVAGTLVCYIAALAFHKVLANDIVGDSRTTALVLVIFSFGALEAIDDIFESMFAVFSRPRTIFVRKYLLSPGLQLMLALALAITHFGVFPLAIGFVALAAFAVTVYGFMLVNALRNRQLLTRFRLSRVSLPFREVFGFGVPLITTQLVFLSMNSVSIILLQHQKGDTAVASLRAILPIAQMNQLVIFTFTLLFMPLAARLYARGDTAGMRDAYWHTAIWLTVLSFPVFAISGPLAHTVTLTLFGPRYAGSAVLLGVISLGLYWNAALGFNALTLQTYGRLRFVVIVNLSCLAVNLAANIVLIGRYGALGVAIATAATLFIQNVLNQIGMRQIGIPIFSLKYAPTYLSVVVAALGLWAMERTLDPPFIVAMAAAAVASGIVLLVNRSLLHVGEAFPELTRVPVVGGLLR